MFLLTVAPIFFVSNCQFKLITIAYKFSQKALQEPYIDILSLVSSLHTKQSYDDLLAMRHLQPMNFLMLHSYCLHDMYKIPVYLPSIELLFIEYYLYSKLSIFYCKYNTFYFLISNSYLCHTRKLLHSRIYQYTYSQNHLPT